jgi:hypothetical protein
MGEEEEDVPVELRGLKKHLEECSLIDAAEIKYNLFPEIPLGFSTDDIERWLQRTNRFLNHTDLPKGEAVRYLEALKRKALENPNGCNGISWEKNLDSNELELFRYLGFTGNYTNSGIRMFFEFIDKYLDKSSG